MLTKLKQKVQSTMASQARVAHNMGLIPNAISICGVILSFLSAILYAYEHLLPATLLLLFSGYCDALDGTLARLYKQATSFGGFLDSLLDRYADAAVYAGIIVSGLCSIPSGITALIGSLLVSYARARAEAANVKMESIGFAERAERIIILVVASLAAIFWQQAMEIAMIVLAVITNLTVLQRAIYAYNKLKVEAN
ncbi:MAG: archaetidylinositol phosphate synthase [Candidatus Bathyarchaeia archaeon]